MISWSMGGIWQWFLIRFIWYRGLCELWQVLELQCCASAIDLRLSRRRKKRSDKKTTKGVGQFTPPPTKHGCFVLRPKIRGERKTAASRAGAEGPWGLYTWHLKLGLIYWLLLHFQAAAPKFAQVPKTKSVDFVEHVRSAIQGKQSGSYTSIQIHQHVFVVNIPCIMWNFQV